MSLFLVILLSCLVFPRLFFFWVLFFIGARLAVISPIFLLLISVLLLGWWNSRFRPQRTETRRHSILSHYRVENRPSNKMARAKIQLTR